MPYENYVYSTNATPNPNPQSFQNMEGGYGTSLMFYNNLPIPVVVLHRDGTRTTFRPRRNPNYANRFFITQAIHCRPNLGVSVDIAGLEGDNKEYLYKTYDETSQVVIQQAGYPMGDFANTATQQYTLTAEDLNDRGCIFYRDLDIMVATQEAASTNYHPFSQTGLRKQREYDLLSEKNAMILKVVCYTTSTIGGVKFAYIGNNVYQVPYKYSLHHTPGIYITHQGMVTPDGQSRISYNEEFYPFDNDGKTSITLYNTYNEAMSLGDPKKSAAHEIEKLKLEVAKAENEAKTIMAEQKKRQAEYDDWQLAKKRKEEELQAEYARIAAEEARRRKREEKMEDDLRRTHEHNQQLRMMDRKDTSDWLKVLMPPIISLVTGLVAGYLSSKQK